jgi:hypothetical protein
LGAAKTDHHSIDKLKILPQADKLCDRTHKTAIQNDLASFQQEQVDLLAKIRYEEGVRFKLM